MKRRYFIILLLVSTSTCLFSQSNDEQSIMHTIYKMAIALRSNDADALDSLYTQDYTSVTTKGILINKTNRIESIRSRQVTYESFEYKNVKVRVYGNTAIVNAVIDATLKWHGSFKVLTTLILIRSGEDWQIAAAQSTDILE